MPQRPRIAFVIGTRPEAIKCWPLVQELHERGVFEVRVILSGQHRELLDQVVRHLDMPVHEDLNVMTKAQSLESLTARLVERLGEAIARIQPRCLIVQGDTTSVFVGALSAFYAGVPVAHLEAGLRSHDIRHPFPEEMNRRLVSALADLHFAPTPAARQALLAEGIPEQRVFLTGNTGVDALRMMHGRLNDYPLDPALQTALTQAHDANARVIAVTVHRRENRPFLAGIAHALRRIVEMQPHVHVIFPVHLAPSVRSAFHSALGSVARCHLLAPLDYAHFVRLLDASHVVLTDSGGVQEEAPFLGVPVLVMRRTTERPEAIEAGVARLIGEQPEQIVQGVTDLLADEAAHQAMARAISPYGDGFASRRIADVLQTHLLSGGTAAPPVEPSP